MILGGGGIQTKDSHFIRFSASQSPENSGGFGIPNPPHAIIGYSSPAKEWITTPERSFGSNHVVFGGMMLPVSAMLISCCIETG